jgi:hypothetical protein
VYAGIGEIKVILSGFVIKKFLGGWLLFFPSPCFSFFPLLVSLPPPFFFTPNQSNTLWALSGFVIKKFLGGWTLTVKYADGC